MLAFPLPHPPSLPAMSRALPSEGRFCLDGHSDHPEGGWTFLGAEPVETREAPFGDAAPLRLFDGLGEIDLGGLDGLGGGFGGIDGLVGGLGGLDRLGGGLEGIEGVGGIDGLGGTDVRGGIDRRGLGGIDGIQGRDRSLDRIDGLHGATAGSVLSSRAAAARAGSSLTAPPLTASDVPRWVGFVAYDAAWCGSSALGLRATPTHARTSAPVVWLGRYDRMIAIHRASGAAWVLGPDRAACEALAARVRQPSPPEVASVGEVCCESAEIHRAAIERALEAIGAGDIYQVNLARRWRASYRGSPLPLWLAMREASPVPLGLYLERHGHAVLGRTMERFLRWHRPSGRLWTSPIKGTISRSGQDDALEAAALVRDDKERAEHSMIVDLMRNDLSRIARVGSVRVRDPLRVEPFAGLSHLVSTVECTTRDGVDARQILEATFPPGSVTGTPKLRAVEIIEREERSARGVYTGAFGFVDRAGGLSLAVAIRTAVVEGAEVSYFAGGGLVSASDADREIAETELKARVFLDALEVVRRSGGAPAESSGNAAEASSSDDR